MAFSYGIGDASRSTGQESLRIAGMIGSATDLQFRATGNHGVERCLFGLGFYAAQYLFHFSMCLALASIFFSQLNVDSVEQSS